MHTCGIYLAGGMKSNWQDEIMAAVRDLQADLTFFDPRCHGLKDEDDYTVWDIRAVRASDVVFALLEANNPSGFGMSNEIGYAAAMGKYIIFVDEKSLVQPDLRHYRLMGMNRQLSNYYCFSRADGIFMLRQAIQYPLLRCESTRVRRRILGLPVE